MRPCFGGAMSVVTICLRDINMDPFEHYHSTAIPMTKRSKSESSPLTNDDATPADGKKQIAAPVARNETVVDWQCFAYLTAEKSELYRAIIEVFATAKSEFTLHLRPAQVRASLNDNEFLLEATEVESALQSLESWGNLQSYQDNADVSSLADYYRKRLLYQLTAAGEAAHSSTLTFVQRLNQQAKLDARALDRIADGAGQLKRLALQIRNHTHTAATEGSAQDPLADRPSDPVVDSVIVLTTLRSVCQDADELTSRAQSFFRWLHEQTESNRADLQSFLSYKERLIEYLQDFIGQLISQGAVIAKRLSDITTGELAQIASIAAREETGKPRAGEEREHELQIRSTAKRWQQRLLGLRSWFSRSGGKSAQLEQLRAAARAAIPRLLQLASQMNDRQSGRSDRVADLRELALQFLSCKNDSQAHRLYRASFALSSSRHLKVDRATVEFRDQNPIRNSTRWVDAQPVEFSPQLRKTGKAATAPANRRIVNRTKQRAEAKRRLSLDSGRKSAARETLIALGRRKLSAVGELQADAYRLLLELMELAVTKPMFAQPAVTNAQIRPAITTALSRDGSLQIQTQPIVSVRCDGEPATGNGEANLNASNATEPMSPDRLAATPTHNNLDDQAGDPIPLASLTIETGTLMLPDLWIEVTRV